LKKDTPTPPPVEEKNISSLRDEWIPFGANNLYPQELSELSRSASTHRAILRTKVTFSIGDGLNTNDEKLQEILEDINAYGETADDVARRFFADYWKIGNGYIEVVLGQGYINLYHQDSTTCRIHKGGKSVIMHPDWENVRRSPEKKKTVPIYPDMKKDGDVYRTMIHLSDYESTFNFYGLPDYIAAESHIKIANNIGTYNLTRFKNGFMPSAIIELSADMSEDEAQDFIDDAVDKLTGADDASKILFLAKNGEGDATNVQIINDTSDGSFMELQKITNDNIISAHRWNPALSGIQVAGQLGNNQQILTAYDIVMSTVIREPQNLLLRALKKIFKQEMGLDVKDLHFKTKPPVSLLGAINPVDYISIAEGRRIFHLPELTDEELKELKEEKAIKPKEEIIKPKEDGTDNSN
jgi:capsid portal protein|tara:strand:+ start:6289 stop:7521 length:1233 start_codon:yes stop_codon:yes gene_type:complete